MPDPSDKHLCYLVCRGGAVIGIFFSQADAEAYAQAHGLDVRPDAVCWNSGNVVSVSYHASECEPTY